MIGKHTVWPEEQQDAAGDQPATKHCVQPLPGCSVPVMTTFALLTTPSPTNSQCTAASVFSQLTLTPSLSPSAPKQIRLFCVRTSWFQAPVWSKSFQRLKVRRHLLLVVSRSHTHTVPQATRASWETSTWSSCWEPGPSRTCLETVGPTLQL